MEKTRKLPIGIEDFREIRKEGFYYIDKTGVIEQLLDRWGKANLFTRPRRFGKTLNMSMLRYFFEIGTDPKLFDGLYISQNKELCEAYLGKYPVVFLSLKGVEGLDFEEAKACLMELIGQEAKRFSFLLDSDKLDVEDKEMYRALISLHNGQYVMSETTLKYGLKKLSELLAKHFDQKTILLIDEYDVPLDKAFQNGYYREMVALMRGVLGEALKTNNFLQFAVLTGCLRVSKESIFTGLNNFKVLSITDVRFDEQFGFTEEEVKKLLADYHLEAHLPEMKEWYDGYRFGDADVYCPWDVINHVDRLCDEPDAEPQAYWINTSGNDLVKHFIEKADRRTKDEIERLVAGEVIEKEVRLELTYDEIDNSIENLWSVLYLTGYLTKVRDKDLTDSLPDGCSALMIPNAEIREIFETTVSKWFDDSAKAWNRSPLFDAVWSGNNEALTKEMTKLLRMTISYHDYREDFYHAFLAGIFTGAGYVVESNKEHGEGRSDVIVKDIRNGRVAIFEAKYAKTLDALPDACDTAIQQINDRMYAADFRDDYDDILCYGIAFFKKRCMVRKK